MTILSKISYNNNMYEYKSDQTHAVIDYISQNFNGVLEHLWRTAPEDGIWRNQRNRKWYALLMVLPRSKLGLAGEEMVEVLNVRFDRGEALDFAHANEGILPGYHMNKNNWISIVLDGTLKLSIIQELIAHSFDLVSQK